MAGLWSIYWLVLAPASNYLQNGHPPSQFAPLNGTETMLISDGDGETVLSYFQLYFIFLGIIVLVIQKGSINFLCCQKSLNC